MFFQHQGIKYCLKVYYVVFQLSVQLGHSRTIVGIEETNNFQVRLLVLDPSHKPAQMLRLREGESESAEPPPVLKKIRLTLYSLKSKQYQIVCIDKGLVENPEEFSVNKNCRLLIFPF